MTSREKSSREIEDQFIEAWGDVSNLWGVNRSVGRIHALLYLSSEPLDIETVTERLMISHGNASTSIRDLLSWGVIRKIQAVGERRATYEAEKDPWVWFFSCLRERKRREVDPVVTKLHECVDVAESHTKAANKSDKPELRELTDRVRAFTDFADEFIDLSDIFLNLGAGNTGKLFRAAAKFIPKGKSK